MQPDRNFWIGVALAMLSAICFGISIPIAKLTYSYGVDTATYLAATKISQFVIIGTATTILYKTILPARHDYGPIAFLGLLLLGFGYLHFSAIRFMPVSLVTMIIFLYPIILSAMVMAIHRVRVSRIFVLSLILALFGLFLTLGPGIDEFNSTGSVLALGAAVLIAVHLFYTDRLLSQSNPLAMSAQVNFLPAIFLSGLSVMNGLHVPQATGGWLILLLACAVITLGQVAFFISIKLISALRVSLVMKLEPIISVLGAVWMLGEQMSLVQYIGVFMVISAIFAVSKPVTIAAPDLTAAPE